MATENTAVQAAPPKLAVNACLPFTLKPVPPGDTAAALLPRQALASAPLARVVSLYRQLLAAALGTLQASDHAGMGSVVGGRAEHGMRLPFAHYSASHPGASRLQGTASLAPAADPVLASFPAVLDDEDLSATFMQ